jgi:hypothetical protein
LVFLLTQARDKYLPLRTAWIKNSKAVADAEFEDEQATEHAGIYLSPLCVCVCACVCLRMSRPLSMNVSQNGVAGFRL